MNFANLLIMFCMCYIGANIVSSIFYDRRFILPANICVGFIVGGFLNMMGLGIFQ